MLFRRWLALTQVKVYLFGGQLSVMCGLLVEVVNYRSRLIGCCNVAISGKEIVSRANINVETLFDKADVFIKLATECG